MIRAEVSVTLLSGCLCSSEHLPHPTLLRATQSAFGVRAVAPSPVVVVLLVVSDALLMLAVVSVAQWNSESRWSLSLPFVSPFVVRGSFVCLRT